MVIRVIENREPSRPSSSGSTGPDPTRIFGNAVEQSARMPNVPDGFGGVANAAAGVEGNARAQVAQTFGSMLEKPAEYMENLQLASEDAQQQSTRLQLRREVLNRDMELQKDTEYQALDPMEQRTRRDDWARTRADQLIEQGNFKNPKMIGLVNKSVESDLAELSERHFFQNIVPNTIMRMETQADKDNAVEAATAIGTLNPTDIANTKQMVLNRYSNPAYVAVKGAAAAQQKAQVSLTQFGVAVETALVSRIDETARERVDGLAKDNPAFGGVVTNAMLGEATFQGLRKEYIDAYENAMNATGAPPSRVAVGKEKFTDKLDRQLLNAVRDHNKTTLTAQKEKVEQDTGFITYQGAAANVAATRGEMSDTALSSLASGMFRKLGINEQDARDGKLTDPTQRKHAEHIFEELKKVQGTQATTENNLAAAFKEQEKIAAEARLGLRPVDKKSTNANYANLVRDTKIPASPLEWKPENTVVFNANLKMFSPSEMPEAVKEGLEYGIKGNSMPSFEQAAKVYNDIRKTNPRYTNMMDMETQTIMQELDVRGYWIEPDPAKKINIVKEAKANAQAAFQKLPQTEELRQAVSNEITKWRAGGTNPVIDMLKTDGKLSSGSVDLDPRAHNLFDNEYRRRRLEGASKEIAARTAATVVSGLIAETKMMGPEGKLTPTFDAPEARFNVQNVGVGTKILRSIFGAKTPLAEVTLNILEVNLKKAVMDQGHDPEQKYFLGMPQDVDGKPMYPVMGINKDGVDMGPIYEKDGKTPMLWTFDPAKDPTLVQRQMDADHEHAARELEMAAHSDKINSDRAKGIIPNKAYQFGPKITYPPAPPKGQPGIYAGEEAWRKYRQEQKGK